MIKPNGFFTLILVNNVILQLPRVKIGYQKHI
jgi:hypothetical protein